MEVNDELIDNLAELARIEIPAAQKPRLKEDLQKMIQFVNKLKELDVSHINPVLQMSDAENNYRQDEVKGEISREEAFKNAPEANHQFFLVPTVIQK